MRADLHLHTRASDGALAPAELLQLAEQRGLDCVAITDHDTTAGLQEALELQSARPQILPGIELGCAPSDGEDPAGDIDLLGYAFDHKNARLRAALQRLRAERQLRGQAIVARLRELGVSLGWQRVRSLAAGESIGRPHIAQALVEAGHVQTNAEAFERYLRNGGPAHVPRWRLSAASCITLIQAAGGLAVIAHPGKLRHYERRIESLLPFGLAGIEIIHPLHNAETTALLRRLAKRHGLLMTGGSDFHRPDEAGAISIGRYLAPTECVAAIYERARANSISGRVS